jgi:asparaginyl-tRNA synthetase
MHPDFLQILLSDQQDVAEKDFVQLTYTDAIELLLRANKKFEFPVLPISLPI